MQTNDIGSFSAAGNAEGKAKQVRTHIIQDNRPQMVASKSPFSSQASAFRLLRQDATSQRSGLNQPLVIKP